MQSRIDDAKAALEDIAGIWGDVDQGAVDEADRIIEQLDALMAITREYVRERQEAGEHVGP